MLNGLSDKVQVTTSNIQLPTFNIQRATFNPSPMKILHSAASTGNGGRPWNPEALTALAREQWAQHPEAIAALAACTHAWPDGPDYAYLIEPGSHQPHWLYVGELFLHTADLGLLLFEMLHDPAHPGRWVMGGVQYVTRVLEEDDGEDDLVLTHFGM